MIQKRAPTTIGETQESSRGEQQPQQQLEAASGPLQQPPPSPKSPQRYISSLVSRSSLFLSSVLKQRQNTSNNPPLAANPSPSGAEDSMQQQQQEGDGHASELSSSKEPLSSPSSAGSAAAGSARQLPPASPRRPKPPLPPPPPREIVLQQTARLSRDWAAVGAAAAGTGSGDSDSANQPEQPPQLQQLTATKSLGSSSLIGPNSPVASARRHALQEQSLERDAALGLKVRELKQKRHSSIKSALKHAHLGALRHGGSGGSAGGGDSLASESAAASGRPYELFEPPVTQRTFQRTKRRGAMLNADSKRQMSAETIGLRQLTDEYLHNAGVKPMSTSGQCGLVAVGSRQLPAQAGSCGGEQSAGEAQAAQIEAKLYQATRQQESCGSQESLGAESQEQRQHQQHFGLGGGGSGSNVIVLPGNLPWQSDVSIQCELLRAPPLVEPYETTGDILNTIAGPFRCAKSPIGPGGSGSLDSNTSANSGNNNQLSVTLRRGLTAISQHHLSPGSHPNAAINTVVGSLKKSLSNTLDISLSASARSTQAAMAHHLHSQDSLPAYSSLLNEPDSPAETPIGAPELAAGYSNTAWGRQQQQPLDGSAGSGSGLIGQLASKLGRQSSKKFSASKKGLQRALSFDCRGYKRLEGRQSNESSASMNSQNLLSAKQRISNNNNNSNNNSHNRSTLCLNVDSHSPRPYLPQSASQVDFQLPLLPYERMQEAIVSQRLLEPLPASVSSAACSPGSQHGKRLAGEPTSGGGESQQQQPALDADDLLCVRSSSLSSDSHPDPLAQVSCSPANVANSSLAGNNKSAPLNKQFTYTIRQERRRQTSSRLEEPASVSAAMTNIDANNNDSREPKRKATPPRLLLNIPTIAADDRKQRANLNEDEDEESGEEVCALNETEDSDKGSLAVCLPSPNVAIEHGFGGLHNSNSFCLEPHNGGRINELTGAAGGTILPADSSQAANDNSIINQFSNHLTANDVFARSSNLIKRPSTMMAGEAMNQVAQALNNSSSAAKNSSTNYNNNNYNSSSSGVTNKSDQQQVSSRTGASLRLNRRQAIVPPKLVTDASNSDSEQNAENAATGQLVDVGDEQQEEDYDGLAAPNHGGSNRRLSATEEATVKALRRKRSGGTEGAAKQMEAEQQAAGQQWRSGANNSSLNSQSKRLSGSQKALPTFYIESTEPAGSASARQTPALVDNFRPDSQASTNLESNVSSGSSANVSLAGRRDFTVTSPGGLTVSFGSSRGRRRSSIAVIPQMQICPGDLLVYSKQLIDRMNQPDECEPPQFLTIDADKKGKNIWSSLKLCAQFDNRTLKARNELLCSLEDVLASLQPSTFIDEQLSHYKGMLWNEFLYETESRRSASSEGLSGAGACENDDERQQQRRRPEEEEEEEEQQQQQPEETSGETFEIRSDSPMQQQQQQTAKRSHEFIKVSMSSGGAAGTSGSPSVAPAAHPARARDPGQRSISSRFREKPKLKRGQTVDSVFRIPLIPSSPLKHAQQHRQTPTAHLEDHDLITIEDDERNSPSIISSLSTAELSSSQQHPQQQSSSRSRDTSICRKGRSSSTRSRSGSATAAEKNKQPEDGQQPQQQRRQLSQHQQLQQADSSFETDDAMDLVVRCAGSRARGTSNSGPKAQGQIVRQSSLSTLSSTITRTEQKRQRALWDLFQSECAFFFDHLMTLKNVYMEPLKKIQVEGFAMFADPDVLFGNLDELCCGVYDFCKEFLYIIMRTLKTRPEELNATDVLIKLYKKNPKIDHLRGVYHRYTLNYINALTYLESLRRQVEFVEFEKWSSRDVRCKKLQLTDLLVAPVQHIMRVPIILKDIESHTENYRDREEIRAILAVEEASLRELDDKMRWLKNFERLLEIQKNISWPNVLEMDVKLFIPDFLKEVLSKQPCEKLIVSPRRQIVHEGTLSNLDLGKACDMHVILFDDMLLLTRRKKGLTKRSSNVCKTNSGGTATKDDGSFKYIVYKQPLSLDRFYVHDIQQADSQAIGMKHLFLFIVMNRFQQIINVHSFSAPNDDIKQTWLFKIKKTAERWKKNFPNNPSDQQQQRIQSTTPSVATNARPESSAQDYTSGQQQSLQRVQPADSSASSAVRQVSLAAATTVAGESRQSGCSQQTVIASTPIKAVETDSKQSHPIEFIVTTASANSTHSNVTSTTPVH